MQLRSGYVVPSDGQDWQYISDEHETEDEDYNEQPEQKRTMSTPAPTFNPQTHDAYNDIERPWVPTSLPSCVPRPGPVSDLQPFQSSFQQPLSHRQELLPPTTDTYQTDNYKHTQQAPAFFTGFPTQDITASNTMDNTFPYAVLMRAGLRLPQTSPAVEAYQGFGSQIPPVAPSHPNLTMESLTLPLHQQPVPNPGGPHNANTIPLKCCLCPRKPTFSDVSHLLTHISSKSHLAARFKLEISDKEDDKRTIRLFQEWADQYGITQLLKNRQDAKEQKKQAQLKRQRANGTEASSKFRSPQKKARRTQAAPEPVKMEEFDNLALEFTQNPLNQLAWPPLHPSHDNTFDDAYHTPMSKQAQRNYHLPESPQAIAYLNDVLVADGEGDGDGSSTPKLKGAFWPGMRIFDAATPEMRRMRNQKKHHSVLENMVMTSESVEQTEYVWNEDLGEIERTRNVYDSPSIDGSPSRDEAEAQAPPPKKRRGRGAASAASTSQRQTRSTARGSKANKKGATKKTAKVEEESNSDDETSSSRDSRGLGTFDDGADDTALGCGDIFAGRHQDIQDLGGNPFGGQQVTIPYRNAMQGLPPNRPMSSLFGRQDTQPPFEFFDKENDRSAFSMQQTSDLPTFLSQQRQNMQSGGLNPLCAQRQGNFPFLYSGFDVSRPPSTSFQAINSLDYSGAHPGMNNDLINGLGNNSTYQQGHTSTQHNDFGV
ncbi:hypothetical protein M406DRAFT_332928 [Cryphonectria parasitica EP155]|uniref:Uncharacterized protein n=1 Tax=Cryphonectria parasitica (strain ATCC 38755 / EP155) TaxID=660469 RepID=A0A9P4XX67_CRYP1|nr:uncharacterized protein M406DRAFT_332928 [Cryphonectria parasitica EP155]KAF3762548.1 hypothetical protein M406DRAFT_332928 [Cryphonectria parasitica EP155]